MILIFLGPTKVALRGPKRQYAKVDEPYVISFLLKVLPALPASERIWNGSSATFRTRFDDILKALSIPIGSILPSSLRTGGATTLFQLWDENVQKLMWRGRWQSQRILEHYVQELAATNILGKLKPRTQSLVLKLQALLAQVQHEFSLLPWDANRLQL
mmetsp:Transcript_101717/g.326765  ORF Transcript_101717/g.326765 Transcript_101717/m.326765 type:complete len:158 (+) Transcript_101717:696-1169(+)